MVRSLFGQVKPEGAGVFTRRADPDAGFDDGAQIMPFSVLITADLSVVDLLRPQEGWEREPDNCGIFLHRLIVRELFFYTIPTQACLS